MTLERMRSPNSPSGAREGGEGGGVGAPTRACNVSAMASLRTEEKGVAWDGIGVEIRAGGGVGAPFFEIWGEM